MAEPTLTSSNYSFPYLYEKDKKKEYHKRWVQAILYRSIDENYSTRYSLMAECYKFLDEGSAGELTQHLQKAEDGTELPAPWLTLNTLKTKMQLLEGELLERGYEIKVRALNKEAIDRKLEEKEKLRVRRRLQPLVKFAEDQTGIPLENPDDYIPQTEAELNEYFDLTFKDKAEIIMETALKYLAKRNYWDDERVLLWRDLMAANKVIIKNEIVKGLPRSRRIDPLCFIHDPECRTDNFEDSAYFGEVEYVPLASAAERYNMTEDELQSVYNSYQNYLGLGTKVNSVVNGDNFGYDFGAIAGNRIKWFNNVDGQLRVLVARGCWRDYKTLKHKHEKNERYGTEHLQEITDDVRKRDESKIITNKLEVWRQCTLIGGVVVREWGECPNQARDLSDLETTEAPYKVWSPGFATGRGVSKVEQLAGLQLGKDIAMYNMNTALLRAGAKGIIYDMAMAPEGWPPEKVMRYMKVFGIGFINSKESQLMPGTTNFLKEFDMTISDSINQYILIMDFFDREMDKISGVSPERQGVVQGASQGLGITQSALFQSNLITAPYFKGFERFCSRVLNHQAKLVKIVFPKAPHLFAPIIGDAGVDFLREHIDLDLDEFGAYVEALPPIYLDRQKLENMLMIAVQGDPELIDDAIAIMMEKDTSVALRKFQRVRKLRKVFQKQQEMLAQQQEQELQARIAELESQNVDKQIEGNLQNTDLKNRGSLQRTLAQGRTRLNEKKIEGMFSAIPTPTTSSENRGK